MRRRLRVVKVLFALVAPAQAAEIIPGPINANVVSVYDGDTFTVDAMPCAGVTV